MPQVTRTIHIPRSPSVVWQEFASEQAFAGGWRRRSASISRKAGPIASPVAMAPRRSAAWCWSWSPNVAWCCHGWKTVRSGVTPVGW